MKEQNMTINQMEYPSGLCRITINNIGIRNDIFPKIIQIIKFFLNGDELFFGHYKIDGINLSQKEFLKCRTEIPSFFNTYGEYCEIGGLNERKRKLLYGNRELMVCRIPNDEKVYKIIEKVFHYYLETILFNPKIDWETFKKSYSNYMHHAARDYVLNGYTDFLISYTDSGDFSISFNSVEHNSGWVFDCINQILSE